MSAFNNFRYTLLASSALIMVAPVVHAEDAPKTAKTIAAQEVVVLGHRQQYRGDVSIKSTPQSIEVVDGKLLGDLGITRLDKALELVSGIAHQNNFGGLWDSFAIRGFVGDPNLPSGYLVNGFNDGRGFGGPRDASSVERIEVLKGPGSALFGRGEPGGTVNIITKKPEFVPSGSASIAAGSYDTYRAEGDYTGPLTDGIAFRVNGAYESGNSFRDDITTKKYTISPSVLAKLTDQTVLSYNLELTHQEVPFDRGVVALNGVLGTVPVTRFLGEPGDGPIKVDVAGHQAQVVHKINNEWVWTVGLGYRDTSFKGYSTEAELTASRQKLYVDGQTLSRQRRYRDYHTTSLLPRTEISGRFHTGSFVHHILFGTDMEDLKLDQIQQRFRPSLANPNGINIFNPVYGNLATVAAFTNTLETDKSWGAYVQDQIDLTDQIKMRVGGRYDEYKQTVLNRINSTTIRQAFNHFSPQIGLVYEPNKQLSFYANYAKGFRPNTGTDAAGAAFKPELTDSSEVGMKLETLDKSVSGTIAVYRTNKSNIITSDPVNSGFSIAVGEARSQGVDVDFKADLPGDNKLYASYAYTDAFVTKGLLDPDFAKPVAAGDPLINIPKDSANLMLFHAIHRGDKTLNIGGRVNYVGKRLGETGANFYLPAYTLVGLFASYDLTDKAKLSFDVNNLFDKVYYPSSYSRLWIAPGSPRTYMIKLSYSY